MTDSGAMTAYERAEKLNDYIMRAYNFDPDSILSKCLREIKAVEAQARAQALEQAVAELSRMHRCVDEDDCTVHACIRSIEDLASKGEAG